MLRRTLAIAPVAVALLGGCGGGDGIDTLDVERAVAAAIAERLDVAASSVSVSCPEEFDVDPGVQISCDVVAADGAEPVALLLTVSMDGAVELREAAIPAAAAEAYLAGELTVPAEAAVTVDCGEAPLVIRPVGETFSCTARRGSDGLNFAIVVEVIAIDGTVRYRVEPPPPTTATTTTTTTIRVP